MMLAAQQTAKDIRERLRRPPGGRVSDDTEVISEAERRRIEAAEREERRKDARRQRLADLFEHYKTATRPMDPDGAPVLQFRAIMRAVARYYNVTPLDITSARRMVHIIRPRHVTMYLARHMTRLSLPQISALVGRRDHTTALHAISKIDRLINGGDGVLAGEVADIKRNLGVEA